MKKTNEQALCVTVGFFLFCAVFSSCGGSPAPVATQAVTAPVSSPGTYPPAVSTTDELDIAIREASDYLNRQLPRGNKLLILNIQAAFPALSEYIIDELIANAVNDRVFTVVDRQQLDAIRAELGFQMSGEVDDATAQDLGRIAGAQIIISGAVSRISDLYRLRVRALSVQSAQIEGQFNRNIPDGPLISALTESQATGYGGGTAQTSSAMARGTAAPAPSAASASTAQETEPSSAHMIPGTTTPQGNTLMEQLAWIANQGGNGTIYDIILNSDVSMRSTAVSTRGRNIAINIRSENPSRPGTIQLTGQGSLLTLDANVTLKLQNIILNGHSNNNSALIFVGAAAELVLDAG